MAFHSEDGLTPSPWSVLKVKLLKLVQKGKVSPAHCKYSPTSPEASCKPAAPKPVDTQQTAPGAEAAGHKAAVSESGASHSSTLRATPPAWWHNKGGRDDAAPHAALDSCCHKDTDDISISLWEDGSDSSCRDGRVKSSKEETCPPQAQDLRTRDTTPLRNTVLQRKQALLEETWGRGLCFSQWDEEIVATWMEICLKMPDASAACQANGISGSDILTMTDAQLIRNLQIVKPLHLLKLKLAIQVITRQQPSAPP
ncbi:liprin-alpha-2-like [Erinaceus europaeus]|uniref:Liprin-alpha-2-like n=1 Tax=Erinaceus europaeus TaxID=9365 RepID=A0ABM3YIN9_ERIEU|nr:liprin-alpha-2-like [Erinaceus europaeus]